MPEQLPTTHELTQHEENLSLLEKSELAPILVPAYHAAINLDPRLADTKIVPIEDEEETRYGYARPAWAENNGSGKHEVHVRLSDLAGTLAKYQEAMDKVPAGTSIISEKLGVEPSRATPQLMYVQSVLHEMGHITEFLDNEADPEAMIRRQKVEKAALPIGNATAGSLIAPGTKAHEFVQASWDKIKTGLSVGSIDELVDKQARSYRAMTSESIADDFASDVFRMNPMLVDQLTAAPIENYMQPPVAA